ncbi:MAG: hypothetical protein SP1CHLAM54_03830 [Chlamydiia bacterium]|nr:hypothetical protein [Chlamydiia bacterium]MCH9615298.1 hypothetical protein [Chlamydiia bacterium]MCH9628380.1 hypothetical protein [Chlamydiia bacterium]
MAAILTSRPCVGELIGQGAFGQVYYTEDRSGKSWVCKEGEFGEHEIAFATRYLHGVVTVNEKGDLQLRMPFLPGKVTKDPAQAYKVATGVVKFLKKLQKTDLPLHRDIKLDNLRFDEKGNVVVIDGGLVGPEDALKRDSDNAAKEKALYIPRGSPVNIPPEAAEPEKVRPKKYDMWGLGTVLYQMLSSEFYPIKTEESMSPNEFLMSRLVGLYISKEMQSDFYAKVNTVAETTLKEWSGKSSEEFEHMERVVEVMRGCLQLKPKKRLSVKAAHKILFPKRPPKVEVPLLPVLNPQRRMSKREVAELLTVKGKLLLGVVL